VIIDAIAQGWTANQEKDICLALDTASSSFYKIGKYMIYGGLRMQKNLDSHF
jgi:enolase